MYYCLSNSNPHGLNEFYNVHLLPHALYENKRRPVDRIDALHWARLCGRKLGLSVLLKEACRVIP
jgi:hypothetical protein